MSSVFVSFPLFRRASKGFSAPPPTKMSVRVTVERVLASGAVTSVISAQGEDIEEALVKCLSKSRNMSGELAQAVAVMRRPSVPGQAPEMEVTHAQQHP